MASWFELLFGVHERMYSETKSLFRVEPDISAPACLSSQILVAPNGKRFPIGEFSLRSVAALREMTLQNSSEGSPENAQGLQHEHIVIGDVLPLHARSPLATFQVASQFNGLEFCTQFKVPEDGVECYAEDPTQGPACALACAAGTVYRNYFAPVTDANGVKQEGQTSGAQLNTLENLLHALPDEAGKGVAVVNGYTFSRDDEALLKVGEAVAAVDCRDSLVRRVEVVVHRNVGVVFADRDVNCGWKRVPDAQDIRVTQVFCSGLSIAYDRMGMLTRESLWEPLAQVVLDGCYEATLRQAEVDRREGTGSGDVYLTWIGGGVFGNDRAWIGKAIGRAMARCSNLRLNVKICHYRSIDEAAVRIVEREFAAAQREM